MLNERFPQLVQEVENTGKSEVISFDLSGQNFAIDVSRVDIKDSDKGEYRLSFKIHDKDNDQTLGVISGMYLSKEKTFVSFSATNKGFEQIPTHVKGLIREAITQMVTQGLVEKWFSSMHLSPGGQKMYDTLSADERLKVEKSTEYDGEMRYKLVKSTQE